MSQSGLNFNVAIMATKANGEKLNALAETVANSEATAGRRTMVFMTGSEATVSKVFSLTTTRIRYLDQIADPISTGVDTNFSIVGPGWTINKDISGLIGYCRDGTYAMDKNNKFVNNVGQYLQVYKTDQFGNPLAGIDVTDVNSLETLDLTNIAIQAKPTQNISVSAQLPVKPKNLEQYQSTTNVGIIDSLGNLNNLQLVWTKSDATPISSEGVNVWSVALRDPKGLAAEITEGYMDQGSIEVTDENGQITNQPIGGQIMVEFDSSGTLLGYYDASQSQTTLSAKPPAINLKWTNGAKDSSILIDLGAVGSATGLHVGGDRYQIKSNVDGYLSGDLASFNFTPEGFGIVNYTNNQSIIHCRVPLAMFGAINKLTERASGVFVPSYQSGNAVISFPGESGTGRLETGAREGSAVNITEVYLQMIDSQSNYVGNLKTIETIKGLNERLMQI